MSRFSFLRLSSAIGALSVMFGTVSDAADIPGPDFDAYNEFCDSGRLSPAQLLSESFHTHTTEFCPVPPLFCAHRDALIYMPKIREVVEQMLANPIGNVIIRCLLANFRHGGSRIEIRKGVMHDDGDGHSIPVAGVGLPDATGRISISCFSDGRDMFQSRDLGDYIAGIAIDPSNGVQYIALPTLSGDEQFAHALLYVIRI
ncbi:MAG: hypothetical protein LBB34_04875, partial [Holosporales bacterium]|nr:hypothetical protein [Holosporales bacterium]